MTKATRKGELKRQIIKAENNLKRLKELQRRYDFISLRDRIEEHRKIAMENLYKNYPEFKVIRRKVQ